MVTNMSNYKLTSEEERTVSAGDNNYRGDYSVEITTKLGRTFRYKITDQIKEITFRTSTHEIDNLIESTLKSKYRYCDWDQSHPWIDSEEEIRKALTVIYINCLRYLKLKRAVSHGKEPADIPLTPNSEVIVKYKYEQKCTGAEAKELWALFRKSN